MYDKKKVLRTISAKPETILWERLSSSAGRSINGDWRVYGALNKNTNPLFIYIFISAKKAFFFSLLFNSLYYISNLYSDWVCHFIVGLCGSGLKVSDLHMMMVISLWNWQFRRVWTFWELVVSFFHWDKGKSQMEGRISELEELKASIQCRRKLPSMVGIHKPWQQFIETPTIYFQSRAHFIRSLKPFINNLICWLITMVVDEWPGTCV